MNIRELLGLAELAAGTKEEAEELKEALAAMFLSGQEVAEVVEALEIGARVHVIRNPDFPTRADVLGEEGLIVGIEETSELPFFWDDHRKSCLITGMIGGGKTNLTLNLIVQLVQQGATVWVFDRRHDYLPLLRVLKDTYVIPWHALRLNVMDPPPGVSEGLWLGKVGETFSHAYDLLTGSMSLFEEVLFLVQEQARKEGRVATFLDVCERFSRKDYVPIRTRADTEYRGRVYDRLRLLRRKARRIVNCEGGFDLVSLSECGRVVIFDVSLEEKFRDFLILFLLWYMWCYRSENPGRHLPLVFVLDEARYTLRERKSVLEHYILDIDQLITGSRPFNIGYVLVEQMASQLSTAVVSNTELKIAFNCQAEEIPYVARVLGLSREQAECLRSLEVGQCIASLAGSRCPVPVLLRVPRFSEDERRIPKEEVERAARETVAELAKDVVPVKSDSLKRADGELSLMREIVEHPFRSVTEHMKGLGITRGKFYRALPGLVQKGFIKASKVSTRGRPMKLLELTEKGIAVFEATVPGVKLEAQHGGVAHAYWTKMLEELFSRVHTVERCKGLRCGRIPDLLVDGSLAVEVEASDNVSYAVEKYRGILKEVAHLLVVVEEANEQGLLTELKSALEQSLSKDELERIRLIRVQEVMKELG